MLPQFRSLISPLKSILFNKSIYSITLIFNRCLHISDAVNDGRDVIQVIRIFVVLKIEEINGIVKIGLVTPGMVSYHCSHGRRTVI